MIDGFIALYIFMLAAFTGYEVIARVPVILHTPLMSGSNFVHGIVLGVRAAAKCVSDCPCRTFCTAFERIPDHAAGRYATLAARSPQLIGPPVQLSGVSHATD
jgi:NAD/NADP transhydrogenase alpha subunit